MGIEVLRKSTFKKNLILKIDFVLFDYFLIDFKNRLFGKVYLK
jgi:hypothetical protein